MRGLLALLAPDAGTGGTQAGQVITHLMTDHNMRLIAGVTGVLHV